MGDTLYLLYKSYVFKSMFSGGISSTFTASTKNLVMRSNNCIRMMFWVVPMMMFLMSPWMVSFFLTNMIINQYFLAFSQM